MITYNEGLYDSDKTYEGGTILTETLSDTLALSDIKKTSFARELTESISFGDIVKRHLNKSVCETLSFAEGLGKAVKKSLTETLLIEERLTKKLNGATIIWEKIVQTTSTIWKKIYTSGYYDSLDTYDQEKNYDGVPVYTKTPKITTIWNKINKP
jgi:hypothetical protein